MAGVYSHHGNSAEHMELLLDGVGHSLRSLRSGHKFVSGGAQAKTRTV
jgi:hypothetical protein